MPVGPCNIGVCVSSAVSACRVADIVLAPIRRHARLGAVAGAIVSRRPAGPQRFDPFKSLSIRTGLFMSCPLQTSGYRPGNCRGTSRHLVAPVLAMAPYGSVSASSFAAAISKAASKSEPDFSDGRVIHPKWMNTVHAQLTGKNLQYRMRRHDIPSRLRKESLMPLRPTMIPAVHKPSSKSDREYMK